MIKLQENSSSQRFLPQSFTFAILQTSPQLRIMFDAPARNMHQTNKMSFSHRNPMKDYQKQKEKLDLIKQECTIEWVGNMILEKKAKVSRLTDEISNIQQYVQALEVEKANILEVISQQNAWAKTENLKQTLKLLDINSK
jgi:septal ring factor EnvC (AmiA/AmiB activator)